MGDAFQIYARTEWGLSTKTFSSLVALAGLIGIAGNVAGSVLAPKLGIKKYTAIATLSSMLGPLGAAFFGFKGMMTGSLVGFLSAGQALGITTTLVSEGAKSGVPQGELAGERSSILAVLKVIGPVWYSMLYVQGQKLFGLKNLPFLFNLCLAATAFAMSQMYL
jgi:hypothetical protein